MMKEPTRDERLMHGARTEEPISSTMIFNGHVLCSCAAVVIIVFPRLC